MSDFVNTVREETLITVGKAAADILLELCVFIGMFVTDAP